MSNTIKFIDTVIRNIAPTNKRQIFWCDGCPGFGLRITPSGTKTFLFKYMTTLSSGKRKSRWITIGKYPEWSIRKARREYDLLYEQVYAYGRDLVEKKNIKKSWKNHRFLIKKNDLFFIKKTLFFQPYQCLFRKLLVYIGNIRSFKINFFHVLRVSDHLCSQKRSFFDQNWSFFWSKIDHFLIKNRPFFHLLKGCS